MPKLGTTKVEVRRVRDGILIQVDDRWHLVLTDDAAIELAAMLVAEATDRP